MDTNLVSLVVPREEARQKIQERIEKGKEIFNRPFVFREDLDEASDAFFKWSNYNKELLNRLFDTTAIMEEYYKPRCTIMVIHSDPELNFTSSVRDIKSKTKSEVVFLESIEERLDIIPESSLKATSTAPPRFGKRIFVVHGHDEAAKEAVSRLIEKLGFKAVVLHEQANAGRTIIEKFEEHSDVGFAVVLLTPDDLGSKRGEESNLKSRARQNVIFELGYFIGKLGRQRVCALKKDAVEIPSDLSGFIYTAMDSAGAWRLFLAKEMQKAGLPVDLNKL